MSVSPLLKASSSLSVAWKLYRATDSIPVSPSPAAGCRAGAGCFLLPLQLGTIFLCFESLFVLLKLRLKLPPTGEKQEAEICHRAGGCGSWPSPTSDPGGQVPPLGCLQVAPGIGLPPWTHVTDDKTVVSKGEHRAAVLSTQVLCPMVPATPTTSPICPQHFLNSDASQDSCCP